MTETPIGSLAVAQVVAARTGWLSPVLRSWYAPPTLERRLAAEAAGWVALVGDRAFGAGFRRDVGLSRPADDLAWSHRALPLAGGGWALTGIRFRGLDVTKPFVDVLATSTPPTADDVLEVASHVASRYAAFEPRCVRFDVPDPDGLVGDLPPESAAVDQYVVAGLLESLRGRPPGVTFARTALWPGEPGQLATLAAHIYADLHRTHPEMRLWAAAADQESLAQCAHEGLLFEVRVDGVTAGVVAALREEAHGLTGHVVQEICLDAAHRGQGLAPAVLDHLVRALPRDEGGTLWGTIHPDNTASLRNALSIGRQKVGGYVWVTPPGLPGMPAGV